MHKMLTSKLVPIFQDFIMCSKSSYNHNNLIFPVYVITSTVICLKCVIADL